MDIIVEINNVEHAETYVLYVNSSKVGTYTSTTMIYHVPDGLEGTYSVKVVAEAPYYRASEASDPATVTVTPLIDGILITDNDEDIITDDGDEIMLDD
jgi:predicted transglutaminase-like protease